MFNFKMGCNIIINEILSTIFRAFKKNAKNKCLQAVNTTFDIFAFIYTTILSKL